MSGSRRSKEPSRSKDSRAGTSSSSRSPGPEKKPDTPDSGIHSGRGSPEDDQNPQEAGPAMYDPKGKNDKKHPFEFPWSFWVHDTLETEWQKAMCHLCDFDTVEDFWRLFNHLKPQWQSQRYNYNLFKKGIAPEWEDPQNGAGGRWNIGAPLRGETLQSVWMELCLLVTGGLELGPLTQYVNGIYMARRDHSYRVSVWLSTRAEGIVLQIGEKIRDTLRKHSDVYHPLEYTQHKGQGKRTLHRLQ